MYLVSVMSWASPFNDRPKENIVPKRWAHEVVLPLCDTLPDDSVLSVTKTGDVLMVHV